MALMLAVGKPGVKVGFFAEAGYHVALLALESMGKRSAFSKNKKLGESYAKWSTLSLIITL
jgi:hypothetical protein